MVVRGAEAKAAAGTGVVEKAVEVAEAEMAVARRGCTRRWRTWCPCWNDPTRGSSNQTARCSTRRCG